MSNHGTYILADDGMTPIAADDIRIWGKQYERIDRRVLCRSTIGDTDVSTVFLGTDRRFFGNGPPLLWETMVFGGPLDGGQWRETSWVRAAARHRMTMRAVRRAT